MRVRPPAAPQLFPKDDLLRPRKAVSFHLYAYLDLRFPAVASSSLPTGTRAMEDLKTPGSLGNVGCPLTGPEDGPHLVGLL